MIDYWHPILLGIGFIILFHLLFIKFCPQPKIFWKHVDYYWVALGFIGIIGATYSFLKENSEARLPLQRHILKINYDQLEQTISFQYHYFADSSGFNYPTFENQAQAYRYKAAGEFFGSLDSKIKKYQPHIIEKEEFQYLDSLVFLIKRYRTTRSDQIEYQSAEYANFIIDNLIKQRNVIEKLNSDQEKNDMHWLLLLISPYLLACAVAIRITKVTAEIQELKKS